MDLLAEKQVVVDIIDYLSVDMSSGTSSSRVLRVPTSVEVRESYFLWCQDMPSRDTIVADVLYSGTGVPKDTFKQERQCPVDVRRERGPTPATRYHIGSQGSARGRREGGVGAVCCDPKNPNEIITIAHISLKLEIN